MTADIVTPRATARPQIIAWILLACLLALAGSIRWYRIDKESLTIDEYWALYLSTGRGEQLFNIPYDTILSSPPSVGFAGAPPWWKIWTGIAGVTHPPFYYLALRWWVDCFGSADASTRCLSMIFSLGAIVLMFDVIRRIVGSWKALIAAGLMTFSSAQIDFSQIVRPYTMLIFFALALCDAIIAIDRKGISIFRIVVVAGAAFLLAMTHYFALGIIAAAGAYAFLRFRTRERKLTLAAIAISLILALAIWGPTLWQTRHVFSIYKDFSADPSPSFVEHLRAILIAPLFFCFDPSKEWGWITFAPLGVFVYALPIFRWNKSRELLLWWLVIAGTVGIVVVSDILHHSIMVAKLRYLFLMSPAVYAIIATGLPGRLGIAISTAILCCVAIYGISRVQTGPEPGENWRIMGHMIHSVAGPGDVVCLIGYYSTEPALDYFVVAHYTGDWNCRVVFIDSPPDQALRNELARERRVWMVGHAAASETHRLMPGWAVGPARGFGPRNVVWLVVPPQSAKLP